MTISRILIANRGEIAVRIAQAAADLNIAAVTVFAEDDAEALHTRVAHETYALEGKGASAYLDMDALLRVARAAGCDAVHPGYGFLSENAEFARRCMEEGLRFIGPTPEQLERLGDKVAARELAQRCGVPVVEGTSGRTSLEEVQAFRDRLGAAGAVMLKAIAGGGGRGMRIVRSGDDLAEAYQRCGAEAAAAFGDDGLYAEQLMERARHVEVQVLGDATGDVVHLWERECSLQRRNQKLVEIAPSPSLSDATRKRLAEAALAMAREVGYGGLGTFEFLVDDNTETFAFIETNPRLQVEHTVTEAVTGVDLVQAQVQCAAGATLADLGLWQEQIPAPSGYAVQARVNMETMDAKGNARPAGGTLRVFEAPTGPGVRVDTFGYSGYTTSPRYDSLLAKVIVHSRTPRFVDAADKAYRALCAFRVDGVATNIPFLQNLLSDARVRENAVYTRFVDEQMAQLAVSPEGAHPQLYVAGETAASAPASTAADASGPEGTTPAAAPMQGLLVECSTAEGETVRAGQEVAVVEAMKMQHVVTAPVSGQVRKVVVAAGDAVEEAQPLLFIEPVELEEDDEQERGEVDPDFIRPDLAETLERHRLLTDAARPEAVAKRHRQGNRTARENVEDLCDPGSFIEYGGLTFAAQRKRRSVDDLMHNTPADGLVTGLGSVNGELFDDDRAQCAVLAYDYTVLAGTQGTMNHKKTDRILTVAEEQQLPVIFFTEGGGGRPGDTDNAVKVAGLDTPSFVQYARLSGLAPRIGVVNGRCFAGNAVFAGSSDLIIATRNSSLGMAGPAMIEGGGLGVFAPEEVGPMSDQVPNGVVDCLVDDEAEATGTAKRLLGYFQGAVPHWSAPDQRLLRNSIPENRLRSYDVRSLIATLADDDSVLELREQFAPGMITAFIRIEGRPFGLIANNPRHLGGAIDGEGADKAARFMQLCDAFDVPMVSLCDTPGFMVGPEAEKSALVRHTSRMFVTAASMQVPIFTVVLRKGYGLGAQGMAAGSFHSPVFNIAWPTGEFGGMGLEGAVRLAYRKELDAEESEEGRNVLYDRLVAEMYERGKALSMAVSLEIDAVIDPADTRSWILRGLKSARKPGPRDGKRRPMIDTW
ncbi:carboxyl transferase domain-containing protein [Aquisalimonas sp. APHAB1-3]|uniref:carboxyl transferase domain-containing protein n=1 Tax=Aquisalimonas sp. APHAB1-3 TaxID=3402080 RepID=UPI003AAF6E03